MTRFFISYNKANENWAEWIAWTLEEAGHSVTIQAWDFRPGGNFVLEMQEAAKNTDKTIAVLSNAYLSSEFTHSEWAAAFVGDPQGHERKLIPVRVSPCKPDGILRPIIYVDLVGLNESAAREQLLSSLSERIKPAVAPTFPEEFSQSEEKPIFPSAKDTQELRADEEREHNALNKGNVNRRVDLSNRSVHIGGNATGNTIVTGDGNSDHAHDMNFTKLDHRKKILILAASPKDMARTRLDEEVRDITEGLQLSRHWNDFEIVPKWAVRTRDFQRAMLRESPQIVHFSGYGGEAGIFLEDEKGNTKPVSSDALASLFKLFSQETQIECVLFNGCSSQQQAEAITEHVPYVIGMKKPIGDRAAIEFAVGFYDALGSGKSMEFAFESGKAAIAISGSDDSDIPVLIKGKVKLTDPRTHGTSQTKDALRRKAHSVDARHSKGVIVNPSVGTTVNQSFGNTINIDTGGGDYSGRDIRK